MQPSDDSADELERLLVEQEASHRARIAANPDDVEAKFVFARFLAEMIEGSDSKAQEKWQDADALFQEVLSNEAASSGREETLTRRQQQTFARYRAWYASFLEKKKLWGQAEDQYTAALALNPAEPLALGNYALFAQKHPRKSGSGALPAAKMLEEAIAVHPRHGTLLLKLAAAKKAKLDLKGAEKLYMRAVDQARDDDGEAAGSYAVFLHAVRQDSDKAEVYYRQAVAADPSHANNLSNFGLFLSDVRGDPAGAESCYQGALQADPNHANAAYNYAVLLDGPLKRHKDAEAMYRRVLSNDSNHAYALYNLAILLEEGLPPSTSSSSANKELPSATAATVPKGHASAGSNEPEVLSLFERACAAAPDDALSCADLGRFLLVRKRNYNAAEASLNKALELDPHCSVALFHMGLLRADAKSQGPDRMHDLGAATLLWQRLVATDPTHVAGLRRLARLEAEHLKDWPAADKHYAQAVKAANASRTKGSSNIGKNMDDLDGLLREVNAIMAKAPVECDLAMRAISERDGGSGRQR